MVCGVGHMDTMRKDLWVFWSQLSNLTMVQNVLHLLLLALELFSLILATLSEDQDEGEISHISFLKKAIDRKKCLDLFLRIFMVCMCAGICMFGFSFYQTENILFSCLHFLLTNIYCLIW